MEEVEEALGRYCTINWIQILKVSHVKSRHNRIIDRRMMLSILPAYLRQLVKTISNSRSSSCDNSYRRLTINSEIFTLPGTRTGYVEAMKRSIFSHRRSTFKLACVSTYSMVLLRRISEPVDHNLPHCLYRTD